MIIFQYKIVINYVLCFNFIDRKVKLCSTRYYLVDLNVSPTGNSKQFEMFVTLQECKFWVCLDF